MTDNNTSVSTIYPTDSPPTDITFETKLAMLDETLGHELERGAAIAICGKRQEGKTTLALTLAARILVKNEAKYLSGDKDLDPIVLFLSSGQDEDRVMRRMFQCTLQAMAERNPWMRTQPTAQLNDIYTKSPFDMFSPGTPYTFMVKQVAVESLNVDTAIAAVEEVHRNKGCAHVLMVDDASDLHPDPRDAERLVSYTKANNILLVTTHTADEKTQLVYSTPVLSYLKGLEAYDSVLHVAKQSVAGQDAAKLTYLNLRDSDPFLVRTAHCGIEKYTSLFETQPLT